MVFLTRSGLTLMLAFALLGLGSRGLGAAITAGDVRRAIERGVEFLKKQQDASGRFPSQFDDGYPGGTTALALLALHEAGVPVDDPVLVQGLRALREVRPEKVYSLSLQTMVFSTCQPQVDFLRIQQNVEWLLRAMHPDGYWDYGSRAGSADNSCSQFAVLALRDAALAGVDIPDTVWRAIRKHWQSSQQSGGGWPYRGRKSERGSMTVAGIASLLISGSRLEPGFERRLANGTVTNCGKFAQDVNLSRGFTWLGRWFSVSQNPKGGKGWHFYYLYGLERAGRLSARRHFGPHDWYQKGAEWLVEHQRGGGSWAGGSETELLATSFALLFLSKGRSPVLINKLQWCDNNDWNNDRNDVRHLTAFISERWEHRLTWQIVDLRKAKLHDLMQAPICYLNGHTAPQLKPPEIELLRQYLEQGKFLLAEACCNKPGFDRGFRQLVQQLFPEPDLKLEPLPDDHPVWTSDHEFTRPVTPIYGIDLGCRTSVMYLPQDLSCWWEQQGPDATQAFLLGGNIVAYATGREIPADKLTAIQVVDLKAQDRPKRGALRVAKLKHGGGWNTARQALPKLMAFLRENVNIPVVAEQRDLGVADANLRRYPLACLQGRGTFGLEPVEIKALRDYLLLGNTLWADACCGRGPFDASFRRLMADIFPKNPLQPIPVDDPLMTASTGYALDNLQLTAAAGGGRSPAQLEGIRLDDRWVVIYSKYDISCALERQSVIGCKGYISDDAYKIAANIVLYALIGP